MTAPVSAEEALHCPFCNSTNLNIIKGIHRKPVACNDCLGNSPSLENWNRRATDPSGAKVPGWLPIEAAPKTDQQILTFRRDLERHTIGGKDKDWFQTSFWSDAHRVYVGWPKSIQPTHWMPLPAPPDPNLSEGATKCTK